MIIAPHDPAPSLALEQCMPPASKWIQRAMPHACILTATSHHPHFFPSLPTQCSDQIHMAHNASPPPPPHFNFMHACSWSLTAAPHHLLQDGRQYTEQWPGAGRGHHSGPEAGQQSFNRHQPTPYFRHRSPPGGWLPHDVLSSPPPPTV